MNCCPPCGFANVEERNSSDSQGSGFSLFLLRWEEKRRARGKVSRQSMDKVRESSSECEMHGSKRAVLLAYSCRRTSECEREWASERASFIGSVWMQFGRPWLRDSEGPRNVDHSVLLKDSACQGHLLSLHVHLFPASPLAVDLLLSRVAIPRAWILSKRRASDSCSRRSSADRRDHWFARIHAQQSRLFMALRNTPAKSFV